MSVPSVSTMPLSDATKDDPAQPGWRGMFVGSLLGLTGLLLLLTLPSSYNLFQPSNNWMVWLIIAVFGSGVVIFMTSLWRLITSSWPRAIAGMLATKIVVALVLLAFMHIFS